jgi:hypothetical protein
MVSDEWRSEDDNDKELFIERDSERFGFVLDFMRDNAVTIPLVSNKVTKQSILNELTYFGFQDVGEEAISVEFNPLDAPKFFTEMEKTYKEERQKLEGEREKLDNQIAGSILGYASCVRYFSTANLSVRFCRVTTCAFNNAFEYSPDDPVHYLDINVCKKAELYNVQHNDGSHLLPYMDGVLLKYGLRATDISAIGGSWIVLTGEGEKEIHSGVTDVTVTLSKS